VFRGRLRPVRSWLAASVVLVALAHGAWNNIWGVPLKRGDNEIRGAYPRSVFNAFAVQRQQPDGPGSLAEMIQAACPGGNVLLHVKSLDEPQAREQYFQMSYVLYPRRVYVSEPSTAVGSMPEADFDPNAEWTRERGVQWVVDLSPSKDGIDFRFKRVPPAPSSWGTGGVRPGEGGR
jgi:hypothetical protein